MRRALPDGGVVDPTQPFGRPVRRGLVWLAIAAGLALLAWWVWPGPIPEGPARGWHLVALLLGLMAGFAALFSVIFIAIAVVHGTFQASHFRLDEFLENKRE